jgi:hypothetical protein
MNGLSLIFAVVLILAVAAVSGVVILMMLSGAGHISKPPLRKRHSTHASLAGHRG